MRLVKAAGAPAAAALASFFVACIFAEAPASAGSPNYTVGGPYRIIGRWYRPQASPNYDRVGVASWYGAQFHGRRTASGERFDMRALTAAHPTLPLATLVRVTNLANGRSVTVRVNDRGPYAQGRLIDLSRASARALGFEAQGTARVRVTVLTDPAPEMKSGTGLASGEDDPGRAAASTSARNRPRPRRGQRRPVSARPAGRGRSTTSLSYLRSRTACGRRDGRGASS